MAALKTPAAPRPYQRPRADAYPTGGFIFDWTVVALASWFLLGLYLDGWAHNNLPGSFETFFTPWHGVMYSAFFATTGFHLFHQIRNMARGHTLTRALPAGYWLSLVGLFIFGLGGPFDYLWHNIFGFEEDVQALLSPAHMLLATGGVLFAAGPLRALLRAPMVRERGWAAQGPGLIALFLILNVLTFFTQYTHFISNPWVLVSTPLRDSFFRDLYGITSVLIPTVLLMSVLLFALRQWRLPTGTVMLFIGGNTLLMFLMNYRDAIEAPALLVATLLGSAIAEALYRWLMPAADRPAAVRLFAFIVPGLLFGLYFAALLLTVGTWWSIHMWLGVTFNAGVVGLLLSYLVFPPGLPAD